MSNSEKRPLQAEDLYQFKLVADPQLSPDGQHLLFPVQRVDRQTEKKYFDLYVAHTGSGALRQFTYGDYTDTHPRWSPDGTQIAFLSNRQNEKQMQIFLLPFAGGEARPVTSMEGSFGGFEWSPDGSRLVVQFRKKDEAAKERENDEQKKKLGVVARHITNLDYKLDGVGYLPEEKWHIWTIELASGEATQLTDGSFNEVDPTWSPDGQQILFTSNRHPQPDLNPDVSDMYLIPADGSGEMQKVEIGNGRIYTPRFSPDGTQVAFLGRQKKGHWYQNTTLYVVPTTGGEPIHLSAGADLHLSTATLADTGSGTAQTPPTWSNDGQWVYIQATEKGNQPLLKFAADGSGYERVIDEPGLVGSFSFSADQSKLGYLWGTIDMVGRGFVRDMTTGESKALSQFNQAWLAELAWGDMEEHWIDGPDGTRLHGWILKPPGFDPSQKYPSILEIHGGPMTQYGNSLMHEFHYLAGHGYVVYACNPRGSQGYGEAFAGAIANQWGTVDYADVMAWTDFVASQPYIDTARMGVTGGSYGGYMTTWIIGHTDRFKAAVAQRVVSNFLSFYGSSDMNWGTENLGVFPGQPWNDTENYWKQSPIAFIGNAKTPTLVIHSEQDLRCDQEQGEQLFVALRKMGVDTELVLFPEESHGLSRAGRTDRRIQRLEHMRRWFDKYLK